MSGLLPAFNLRELRDRTYTCKASVIYHHFCETPLAPSFDYPDLRNDYAIWVMRQLDDDVLAERLAIIDPYAYDDMEHLRAVLIDILDERMNEVDTIVSVQPGHEFHFMDAITVVFDTGSIVEHPRHLVTAVTHMTSGSIYYHFLEARRRTSDRSDDFCVWLRTAGGTWEDYIKALKSIDYLFYSLTEMRAEIVNRLKRVKRRRVHHGPHD